MSFDRTIICKIEDASNRKEGKYTVSDGTKSFTVYSSDTGLRESDSVYVTIPEGDFEKQKMIVGKEINEEI
jgi:hypothetical protein